jgi:hypothetical protein
MAALHISFDELASGFGKGHADVPVIPPIS